MENSNGIFSQQYITTTPQYISCVIENGVIYQIVGFNQKQAIGVDNATINDSIALAEQYYNRLVEIGDIKKPKTQDEINLELLETIKSLKDEINNMKGGKENGYKANSQDNGAKPRNSEQSILDV